MLTLRYAITNRLQYAQSEPDCQRALIAQAERLASDPGGAVDFIQLREKDLSPSDLIGLARKIRNVIRSSGSKTRLLVNSRADIACAAGADGVHLPSGDGQLSASQARLVFGWRDEDSRTRRPVVSVSCHNLAEVERACDDGVDLILFGPVFGKFVDGQLLIPGTGLAVLEAACFTAGKTRVLALGGVTAENIDSCIQAGASGIAAIRLFR